MGLKTPGRLLSLKWQVYTMHATRTVLGDNGPSPFLGQESV